MNLGDRRFKILKHIVEEYIRTGLPVGSSRISKIFETSISPATIRNDMSCLERDGFLFQPHISSGRVPSDYGYRAVVDFFESSFFTGLGVVNKRMESLFFGTKNGVESMFYDALELLSANASLPSILLLPLPENSYLVNLRIVKTDISKAKAVLVFDSGVVKYTTIPTYGLEQKELDKVSDFVLELFNDTLVSELSTNILKERLGLLPSLFVEVATLLYVFIKENSTHEIHVSGVGRVFELEEFLEPTKTRKVIKVLENEDLLYQVMKEVKDGILVKIGRENKFSALHELSFVMASFESFGGKKGAIGVTGPTRIPYDILMREVLGMSLAIEDEIRAVRYMNFDRKIS